MIGFKTRFYRQLNYSDMKIIKNKFLLPVIALLIAATGCKKQETTIPEEIAHFTAGGSSATLQVLTPDNSYTLPIGATTVSNTARNVVVDITSPTGAVEGTHYTVTGGKTLNIPAGEVLSSITVKGIVSQYTAGRKDSLVFKISNAGNLKGGGFDSSFVLVLRGPCFEGEVYFPELGGNYRNTFEGSYGPYTSSITDISYTAGATTGSATINNIYDNGIEATANFSFASVGNFTVTIPEQNTGFTVGGRTLYVATTSGITSTFTYCTNTVTLYLDLYTSAGLYDRFTMSLAR